MTMQGMRILMKADFMNESMFSYRQKEHVNV